MTYNTAAIQLYESCRFLKIEYFPRFYFLHGKHYDSWKKCTQVTQVIVVCFFFNLQTSVSCSVVGSCSVFAVGLSMFIKWDNLHVWIYVFFFDGGLPFSETLALPQREDSFLYAHYLHGHRPPWKWRVKNLASVWGQWMLSYWTALWQPSCEGRSTWYRGRHGSLWLMYNMYSVC